MLGRVERTETNNTILETLRRVETLADGRKPLWELYAAQQELVDKFRFARELIYTIDLPMANGETIQVPVFCFLSPAAKQGEEALWILAGIHGEEPAPPDAAANQSAYLGRLGQRTPLILAPILNPAGYVRNWRFHDREFSLERRNVTDCRHLLPDRDNPTQPMLSEPVHALARSVMQYFNELVRRHPARVFIDLHEDKLLEAGYLYSQGPLAGNDAVALLAMEMMSAAGVRFKPDGRTRFPQELIRNGLVYDEETNGPVQDGSIDQWAAASTVFIDGQWRSKPAAQTVLVPETPANEHLSLSQRIAGHESVLQGTERLWELSHALPGKTPERLPTPRRNVVEQWLDSGLAAWRRTAMVDFLTDGRVRVPFIQAEALTTPKGRRPLNVLLVAGMHLEETGGPRAALKPENFDTHRANGVSFTIFPALNQHGLQFPEDAPEELLRRNENGVNYNDCWWLAPHATREADLVAAKIRQLHARRPFDIVVSCHEDSTALGQGYVFLQGLDSGFQAALNTLLRQTPSGRFLPAFTDESNPSAQEWEGVDDPLYRKGAVQYGWQIVDEYDGTSFESWVHEDPQLRIPAVTVEGPFGEPLADREKFQLDVLGSILSAVRQK